MRHRLRKTSSLPSRTSVLGPWNALDQAVISQKVYLFEPKTLGLGVLLGGAQHGQLQPGIHPLMGLDGILDLRRGKVAAAASHLEAVAVPTSMDR